MDLLVIVDDPDLILDSDEWMERIAPAWIALRHPGPFLDLPVRQVLFAGALDFDMVPIRTGTLESLIALPWIADLIGAGFRILVDKDSELTGMEPPPEPGPLSSHDMSPDEFHFVIHDFLFQLVWAAKDDVDCYMRADMARMIE